MFLAVLLALHLYISIFVVAILCMLVFFVASCCVHTWADECRIVVVMFGMEFLHLRRRWSALSGGSDRTWHDYILDRPDESI